MQPTRTPTMSANIRVCSSECTCAGRDLEQGHSYKFHTSSVGGRQQRIGSQRARRQPASFRLVRQDANSKSCPEVAQHVQQAHSKLKSVKDRCSSGRQRGGETIKIVSRLAMRYIMYRHAKAMLGISRGRCDASCRHKEASETSSKARREIARQHAASLDSSPQWHLGGFRNP